ncbi:hypothetical protein OU649_23925, partial [Escherichia coli]|nr:hypothetical protein [Escherichia coli]
LPSETMIWQPEFTDKTLSRKPGAVHNPKWSQQQQNSFKWLAVLLEEKYAGEITISAESSVNQ